MSDHRANRTRSRKKKNFWFRLTPRLAGGQALIEYALILVLVVLAIVAVVTVTGPAVGNVFSNTVYNLLGGTIEPRETLAADAFWDQVTAVASYTPESPSLMTNTPAPPTATPTIGPSPTPSPVTPSPTPSNTPTPGPSPTPPDFEFDYPFYDPVNDDDWWQHDFDDLMKDLDWDAEYWDYDGWKTDMSDKPDGTGKWQTTHTGLHFEWSSGESPGGGVNENFYARYKATLTLENIAYALNIRKDDGVRVWVGGQIVVDENVPNPGDARTWSWSPLYSNEFQRIFTPAAGENEIIVEFYDSGGAGRLHVSLIEPDTLDEGDCNWALSDEASHSPPSAWSDSPGAPYSPYSYCILKLRGHIDLTGSLYPKLEFWDRYNLRWSTYAMVGISVAGTGEWVDTELHYYETNLGWTRETFDLTDFEGVDFSDELIEIRFILDAHNSSNDSYDGWWIDDIEVKEEVKRRYTVGFHDDMEGPSHWYAGGTWALSNEQVHSGVQAWSDSPGADYVHGSNNSLELDGVIDLTDPVVIDPEIVFWHRYDLTYHDYIYAEVSTDDRETWQPLTGSYLAYRETNWSWTQQVISLEDYVTYGEIYFRFRLDATSSSYVADGWWIDDFSIRNKPSTVVQPEWCDNMEVGGSDWIPDGTWGVINGSDVNPEQDNQAVTAHSGSQFWSDSPHANYVDDTNSSLQLRPELDLTESTDPEVVFWHQWDLRHYDNLYFEVSNDNGETWNTLWAFIYDNPPVGYNTTPYSNRYDNILSWTREAASLQAYVGEVVRVRFRLDARSHSYVDDGWWLDDICFQEHTNSPVHSLPFSDGFELGDQNWYAGGSWAIAPENKHSGGVAYSDSYGVPYKDETNSVLELKGMIDLTGTVKPTLYYWEAFNLQYDDYALIDINVSSDGGATWSGWDYLSLATRRYETTTSWDRRQINLQPYIGQQIRLRFRLLSVYSTNVAEGWWLDDVSVIDRDGIEPIHALPFNEDAEDENDYWVFDGTWARVPMFRTVGSGSALGPGGWTAQYYNDDLFPYGDSRRRNREFDDGELVTTRIDPEINFDWGYSAPSGVSVGSDYFLVRWTRTIYIPEDKAYQVQAGSDDGIRVFLDGDLIINQWINRGYPSPLDTADVDLTQGNHTFVVEYYEWGGRAQVRVNFGSMGMVFHDSPAGDYFKYDDMSMTLEGMIDLSGTSHPALSYWEKRYLPYSRHDIITEVSTNEGFTWTEVKRKSGTDSEWQKELIDLSAYAGQQINIRFRLDARYEWRTPEDGWYIDDIQVAD
ncbi:MAG: hypothetical protein JXJ20_04020 [Anaerolineae bacterium]|nr:hypothetical protein [Anaerolineae bacterium]